MLLVGFVIFALTGLAVWAIRLLQPDGKDKRIQLPQQQPPKIVIRPRPFRKKGIYLQQAVTPPAAARPTQSPASPLTTPPPAARTPQRTAPQQQATAPTTRPPITRVTLGTTTPQQQATAPTTQPPITRVTLGATTPQPAPQTMRPTASPPPPRTVQQQPRQEPVTEVGSRPIFGNGKIKRDLDTVCKRTGRVVRNCGCGCREMNANVGV
jgi:hypothetical protein